MGGGGGGYRLQLQACRKLSLEVPEQRLFFVVADKDVF